MAFSTRTFGLAFLLLSLFLSSSSVISGSSGSSSQMSPGFYLRSCPRLNRIVRNGVRQALAKEPRLGASILRLFFHDCFVNGCDGSILLDDTTSFTGEKNAFPNRNSARGFEVIDKIKTDVEAACPGTVSCADILALATRFGVRQLGGPSWRLDLGRRDARTASQSDANRDLPSPRSNLTTLITSFGKKGLTARDMTALSGAHTIGKAQCRTFRTHIYNETNIQPSFAQARQAACPFTGGDSNLADLDRLTPRRFDNGYYRNLVVDKGLLHSDQELFNHGSQDSLVRRYSNRNYLFFWHFSRAMTKMSNISPLTGTNGEIRTNCRLVN